MEIRIQGSRWCDLTNNWESQNFLLLFQKISCKLQLLEISSDHLLLQSTKSMLDILSNAKKEGLFNIKILGPPCGCFLTHSEFLEKQSVNSFPFGPFQEEYLLLYDSSLHLICCELHFERNSFMKSLCKEEEAFPLK